jgi:ADP-ribose pyrophosphatase
MKGELKESRVAYQSEWLEVHEDFLSIKGIKNTKKNDDDDDDHHDNNNNTNNNNTAIATNDIKMFNKIRTKNDGTVVVPVFPDDSLLLIETYRYGVDEVLLEFPGGLIEINEEPIESARKELLQETGYICKTLEPKGWFYTWPSRCNQKIHVFLAKGLEEVSKQNLEATENIKTKILSKDEVMLKFKNQELTSGGMIAALFYGYFMPTSDNKKFDMHFI